MPALLIRDDAAERCGQALSRREGGQITPHDRPRAAK
jgi:hypothetical protein